MAVTIIKVTINHTDELTQEQKEDARDAAVNAARDEIAVHSEIISADGVLQEG